MRAELSGVDNKLPLVHLPILFVASKTSRLEFENVALMRESRAKASLFEQEPRFSRCGLRSTPCGFDQVLTTPWLTLSSF